jgi:WXG100 family type VII secretion target
MPAAPDVFTVDADELIRVVEQMAGCESGLRDLAAELARRVEALHLTWDGASAYAHRLANAEWEQGFAGMREALGRMRSAAEVAHGNYTSAAETNTGMWQQLR